MEKKKADKRATVEWMRENYDKMNRSLFNGALGPCDFEVFTTGTGSRGNTLGVFKLTGGNIRYRTSERRLFKQMRDGSVVYITPENFVDLCKPTIGLNGNYLWTEKSMLSTLVHEMCHYYVERNGNVPKQAHGPEFRRIAYYVSAQSNDFFSVQRLASAEEMNEIELIASIKKSEERKTEKKVSSMRSCVLIMSDGSYRLTNTTSQNLLNQIITQMSIKPNVEKILMSKNADIVETLYNKGFQNNMRTYRYWDSNKNPILHKLIDENDATNWAMVYRKHNTVNDMGQKKTFKVKTSKGEVRLRFSSKDDLYNQLRERFPKASDEAILKLIDNPLNYINETINTVLKKVIKEYINDELEDEVVDIFPNMNLGLYVPDEI